MSFCLIFNLAGLPACEVFVLLHYMKKLLTMLAVSMLALFALPSCETTSERVPVEPESGSTSLPWNKMQEFEKNAIFGPMERRR